MTISREMNALHRTNEPVLDTVKNCLLATQIFSKEITVNKISGCFPQMFSDGIAINKMNDFFSKFDQKDDRGSLPQSILVVTDLPAETTASLYINFFTDRLVTRFQDTSNSTSLSVALRIIRDLSEISNKSPLDGKGVAFYPSKAKPERVVLTTSRGELSMSIEMLNSSAHLFKEKFAQKICPLLGLNSSVNDLVTGITQIYLGRRILGLEKAVRQSRVDVVQLIGYGEEVHSEYESLECMRLGGEYVKIVTLIRGGGSEVYTQPLL